MKFHIVIPARYGSERLPAKPLLKIAGRPLIQHVYERGAASGAVSVTVATDDERIASACRDFGAEAILTVATHFSGTDRIAEVAAVRDWGDDTIVVNLQGDEPLMPAALIAQAAAALAADPDAGIATLAAPIHIREEFLNPNAVKVVCDAAGRALYFSRAPIPARRSDNVAADRIYGLRHIGLYAYRVGTLQKLAALAPCPLELSERLEQLRALWHGIAIRVECVDRAPPAGIDTVADVERIERLIEAGEA